MQSMCWEGGESFPSTGKPWRLQVLVNEHGFCLCESGTQPVSKITADEGYGVTHASDELKDLLTDFLNTYHWPASIALSCLNI